MKQHGPEVLPCTKNCVHELMHDHVQDENQVVFVTLLPDFRYTWRVSSTLQIVNDPEIKTY